MSDINTDITIGLKFLNKQYFSSDIPSDYCFAFARTNEDIETYFSKFPIKNGIISTVAGSGDQQLQASLYAPKEIHVFDQNPFSIQMAKLKTAGCLALTHERFKKFFDNNYYTCFSKKDYKEIREYLDEGCRKFWDTMYKTGEFEKNHIRLVRIGHRTANTGPNSYETEENFYKTKSNLEKISIYYYHATLFKFFSKIVNDKNFDAIFLSNIYDWLEGEDENIFADYIMCEVAPLLTKQGMIAVYSSVKDEYTPNGLEEIFTESFDMNNKDKVLIYKKD